jgi:alcohol dehydrogenase
MATVMAKLATGKVKPVVDSEADFGNVGEALARMEGRDVFGKILLRIA